MMLLDVQKVSKKYIRGGSEFYAVNHADLSVSEGELVAICGYSGSGKSTLFHLIAGLLKPDSGRLLFDNTCISEDSDFDVSDYRNRQIGYIIQGQSVLNSFTVLENVCLPYYISGNKEDAVNKALDLLTQVGLEEYADAYPNQLSGGEMRRVAIARALINNPKLIIADEPTSNLDKENSIGIMKLLRKISDTGIGVIISTHDNIYHEYADRLFVMDKGILQKADADCYNGITNQYKY